jgi:RecB family exonuclease
VQLSPIDKGSIVHDVLDRFVKEGRPSRARLHEIAAEVEAAAEARGITGRRLLWERDRRLIAAWLDDFFAADAAFLVDRRATTEATEFGFGVTGATVPAVEIALANGRSVSMRGKADRIDRLADGRLVVVDYKTGSENPYKNLSSENPVDGGAHLQLPVYARAARAAFADPDVPVEAVFWFVGRGENKRRGYVVDAAVDAVFEQTVSAIVAGIEGGVFVAVPPPPGPRPFIVCPYCDPDGLGTGDRWREWERKYDADDLAGYRALIEDDDEDE